MTVALRTYSVGGKYLAMAPGWEHPRELRLPLASGIRQPCQNRWASVLWSHSQVQVRLDDFLKDVSEMGQRAHGSSGHQSVTVIPNPTLSSSSGHSERCAALPRVSVCGQYLG